MSSRRESVISGSYDATLKVKNILAICLNCVKHVCAHGSFQVWCLKTGNCLQTLRGHEDRVLCLFWEEGDRLFSGSTDNTIKVFLSGPPKEKNLLHFFAFVPQLWSLESGDCVSTLRGHSDAVTCLSREGSKLVSGSLDQTIKLWDADSGECLSTLDWMSAEGHTGVIRCLQADPWRIVSASDDKTLKACDKSQSFAKVMIVIVRLCV